MTHGAPGTSNGSSGCDSVRPGRPRSLLPCLPSFLPPQQTLLHRQHCRLLSFFCFCQPRKGFCNDKGGFTPAVQAMAERWKVETKQSLRLQPPQQVQSPNKLKAAAAAAAGTYCAGKVLYLVGPSLHMLFVFFSPNCRWLGWCPYGSFIVTDWSFTQLQQLQV